MKPYYCEFSYDQEMVPNFISPMCPSTGDVVLTFPAAPVPVKVETEHPKNVA